MSQSNWKSVSITINCRCKLLNEPDENCTLCKIPEPLLTTPFSEFIKGRNPDKNSNRTKIKTEPSWNVSVKLQSAAVDPLTSMGTVIESPNVTKLFGDTVQNHLLPSDNDFSHNESVQNSVLIAPRQKLSYDFETVFVQNKKCDPTCDNESPPILCAEVERPAVLPNPKENDFTEGNTTVSDFSCDVDEKYAGLFTVKRIERRNTEYSCNNCSKTFPTTTSIKLHVIRCQNSSAGKPLRKKVASKAKRKQRRRSSVNDCDNNKGHKSALNCNYCGKPYRQRKLKLKHSREHIDSGCYIKCFWCTPPLYFDNPKNAIKHQKEQHQN